MVNFSMRLQCCDGVSSVPVRTRTPARHVLSVSAHVCQHMLYIGRTVLVTCMCLQCCDGVSSVPVRHAIYWPHAIGRMHGSASSGATVRILKASSSAKSWTKSKHCASSAPHWVGLPGGEEHCASSATHWVGCQGEKKHCASSAAQQVGC
jgi:hypothetical protein